VSWRLVDLYERIVDTAGWLDGAEAPSRRGAKVE
jgi:hypothetical protein